MINKVVISESCHRYDNSNKANNAVQTTGIYILQVITDMIEKQTTQIESSSLQKEIPSPNTGWKRYPMPKENVYLSLNLTFSKQEFDQIKHGFIPEEMEDKWLIIVEDSHIFFYRNWSGRMIYDCLFEETENTVKVIGFYANRNPDQYSNDDNGLDIYFVKDMLQSLIKKKDN